MSTFIDKLAKVLAQAEAASTPEEADAFLAKADAAELSQRARLLKRQIAKKIAETAAA